MANVPELMEPGPESPILLRPAADASFALIDDRPVLFSERSQQIYELNQISAFIWCKLLEQGKPETIADELSELGLGREEARNVLAQAFQQWLDLELVEMEWRLPFAQHASDPISAASNQHQSLQRRTDQIS